MHFWTPSTFSSNDEQVSVYQCHQSHQIWCQRISNQLFKENAVILGLPMSLRQTSLVQVLGKRQGITPPVLLIQYSGILKTRIPPAYIVLMLVRITVDGSMSIGLGSFILRTGDFPIDIIAIYVVHILQGYFVLLSNPSAPPTCTLFQNVQIVDILLNYLIIFFKCSFSFY